jgi:hypothetical protein
MADPGTLGRYGYVGGNPTTFTDLYGFAAKVKGGPSLGLTRAVGRPASHASGPLVRDAGSDDSKTTNRHIDWWNPFTWNDEIRANVGTGLLIAAGVLHRSAGL